MFEYIKPKVSIILPSWFTKEQHGHFGKLETFWFANECLKKMKPTIGEDAELIIINNGSTLTDLDVNDCILSKEYASGTTLIDHSSPVTNYWEQADVLITNKKNFGFAPACNQGIGVARGEYIVIVNNDIIVWPGWIEAMINVFNQNLTPPVGVVMTALMKETSDALKALTIDKIDLTQNYGRWSPGAEFGSCYMIKRELVNKLIQKDGYYYDENFKIGFGEDRDLWDRVRVLGYETYRCHETRVYHRGNMSMSKITDRKNYTTANREYLAEKRKLRQQ